MTSRARHAQGVDASMGLESGPADVDDFCEALAAMRDERGAPLSALALGAAYEEHMARESGGRTRRRRGAYYTPAPIVDLVVARVLGPFAVERRGDLDAILSSRVLDPAMGCGAFLIAALEALAQAAGASQDLSTRREIARRCLFGVDSDPIAARVSRHALARAVLQGTDPEAEGALVEELAGGLLWGDALTGTPAAQPGAPPSATPSLPPPVHWDRELTSIFPVPEPLGRWQGDAAPRATGFDVVIGNPPYLQEARGNSALFARLRAMPFVAGHCERMTDLFHLFICHSLALLREGGRLGLLVPDYWLTRTGASKVREAISRRRLEEVTTFGEERLFVAAAGHHSSILIVENLPPAVASDPLAAARVCVASGAADSPTVITTQNRVVPAAGRFLLLDHDASRLLEHTFAAGDFTLEKGSATNGLQSYPDRVDGRGVFVLEPAEVDALGLSPPERALLKPFLPTREVRRLVTPRPTGAQVLYIDAPARRLVEENSNGRYDRVREHLLSFSEHMTSRARPFGLHRPRAERFFTERRRIIVPRKCDRPLVAPVEAPLWGDESLELILVEDSISFDGLLGVLASTLAHFFFYVMKRQGERLQIDNEVLLRLPLPAGLRPGTRPTGALLQLEQAVACARAVAGVEGAELQEADDTLDLAVAALYGLDGRDLAALSAFGSARSEAPSSRRRRASALRRSRGTSAE